MTDYERHESHHMPHRESTPRWTSIAAGVVAIVTVAVVIVGGLWAYAGVTFATNKIPDLVSNQDQLRQRVAVIEANAKNGEEKQNEILQQLYRLNDKVDRLSDSKADKQVKGWTR